MKSFIRNTDHVLGNNRGHAAGKEHTRQGNNEWLDIHVGNQESLYQTKDNPGHQHDENRRNRTNTAFFHHPCQHHTAHRHEGTDADIDTAGDHDDRHADTDNNQTRIGNKEV